MKKIFSAAFLGVAILVTAGCNSDDSVKTSPAVQKAQSAGPVDISEDSIALTKLVRQFYKWYEEKAVNTSDFDPKQNAGDTLYRGINWEAHNNRVKVLTAGNYFDKQFFDNYQQIAQYLDTALKSGRELWPVNEMPSFGQDVSPWCNCQDTPSETYYEQLTITDLKIENGRADFFWTWGNGSKYNVKAVKNNGAWKISYLDGFNPENFKSNL